MSSAVAPLVEDPGAPNQTPQQDNPFLSRTPRLTRGQLAKCILMTITLIPIIRLLLIIATILVASLYILIITCPCCHRRRPARDADPYILPRITQILLIPVNWMFRFMLLCFGVVWIEEVYPHGVCPLQCGFLHGAGAPRIIVANHCSFLDAFLVAALAVPVGVAKADLMRLPLIGRVMQAVGTIFAPRTPKDRETLPDVVTAIRKVATSVSPRAQPVVIFPEGTTVNQESLIHFNRGAFIPGLPVQPLLITYPYRFFDLTWGANVNTAVYAYVSLCQVFNRIRVEYLPLYTPSPAEAVDADLYAGNVRALMAERGHRRLCNTSNYDGLLFTRALMQRQSLGEYTFQRLLSAVETREAMTFSRQHYASLVTLAQAFKSADSKKSGMLTFEDLQRVFNDVNNPRLAERLFTVLDRNGDGVIDWREMLLAIGTYTTDIPSDDLLALAFEAYDSSNSGSVRVADLLGHVEQSAGTASESMRKLLGDRGVDVNGVLNRDEFTALCRDRPELVSRALATLWSRFGVDTLSDSSAKPGHHTRH